LSRKKGSVKKGTSKRRQPLPVKGAVKKTAATGKIAPPRGPESGPAYVVGIGASAGGLEAFEQFFSHMPTDSGMAFVLIPHLDPTHKSILADLLKRYTTMPIVQAEDGMRVKADAVYIIPPNKDMAIMHGTLQLLDPVTSQGIRHPIDFFFRSLAEDQREKAVCIVLSGTGTEGAQGLRSVKGEGGLVLVQDVKTAKYDGMPSSAIATGLVDYVLPPDKMAEQLLNYIRRPWSRPLPPVEAQAGRSHDLLQKIYALLRSQTGHDFSLYKQNTIIRRIEKRMTVHQIERLQDYVAYLRDNLPETEALFKELLIRVTNFFRDPEAFEVVKDRVLPHVLKNHPEDTPLRIWVPGCSTGEEAYSLAIIVREHLLKIRKNIKVQIFATDIDSGGIETARAGVYAEGITVDVSTERLGRFFARKGADYKVKEEIREMVVFAVQNVVKDPPFSRLDMISCRNLLIYLSAALQKRILPLFSYSLRPEGILFLGSSETIGDHADLFSVVDKKWKIFKVKRSVGAMLPPDQHADATVAGVAAERTLEAKRPGDAAIGELIDQLLLEKYTPPCVIADGKGDILYIHGRTGAYLEPSSGKARLNIVEMAREGLQLELRSALRKAGSGKKDVLIRGLQVESNEGFRPVDLEVRYIKNPEHLRGLVMIVFHPVSPAGTGKTARTRALRREKSRSQKTELELELRATKDHLQGTIEELETSNEELKSVNEELQSSNEEMQSSNEELETSKEELQSVNEELMTVNTELQSKIDELFQANSDMSNLLAGTQVATIFLNNDLRIKRFTPAVTDVINLIQTDAGRPLSDIASKLEYDDMVKDAAEVLRTLASTEKSVRGRDGSSYLIRIMPYRTVANVIDGVVITFIDMTEQKRTQEALSEALGFLDGIVETLREPLVVLDADLRVLRANDAFYRLFQVIPADTREKRIYELGSHQWDIPALRELLEKVLPENTLVRDYPVDQEFPGIGRRKMLLNARKVVGEETQMRAILLVFEDITEREERHEQ
jgi:two-component system CheB/CheR fusion protein